MRRFFKLVFTFWLLSAMVLGIFVMAKIVFAEDSKEVLTLKRDLAQERVARLNVQLSLMQQQFAEGQKYLQEVQKELADLNAKLKAMESKKEEPKTDKPKVEKEKK